MSFSSANEPHSATSAIRRAACRNSWPATVGLVPPLVRSNRMAPRRYSRSRSRRLASAVHQQFWPFSGWPGLMASGPAAIGVQDSGSCRLASENRQFVTSAGLLRITRLLARHSAGIGANGRRSISSLPVDVELNADYHGIVPNVACVNIPVGPSEPSSATRTASAAPSSTVSVPPGLILVFV
jgi:hypothetical protein